MAATSKNQLPAKEAGNFRSIVKLYEQKQYKKAVKMADSILKKFPEHGETLCMKGLSLSHLDKKEEGYEIAKKGLRFDMTSHVCWHALGLMYRADKDYLEAAKCYRMALRNDADNMSILKDLSCLQIHQRLLDGYLESKKKILQLKPNLKNHWTATALAHHLVGHHDAAIAMLEGCEKQFKEDASDITEEIENSEILLYRALILEEAGYYRNALCLLKKNMSRIPDHLSWLEAIGRLSLFLGRLRDARAVYTMLLALNPENLAYALCLMCCEPCLADVCPPPQPPKTPRELTPEAGGAPPSSASAAPLEDEPVLDLKGRGTCSGMGCSVWERAHEITLGGESRPRSRSASPSKGSRSKSRDRGATQMNGASPAALEPSSFIRLLPKSVHPSGSSVSGWMDTPTPTKDQSQRPKLGWKRRSPYASSANAYELVGVLSEDMQANVVAFFESLRKEHPRSDLLQRLPLAFLEGTHLLKSLDAYLRPKLRKGVPSLFNTLKAIYRPHTVPLVGGLIEGYLKHLTAPDRSTFGPWMQGSKEDREGAAVAQETPISLLFTLMLAAQHYDYAGQSEKALTMINKALDHTPTLIDLYMVKARIYKHAGAVHIAADYQEKARQMDLADRYLNTKSVAYLMKADKTQRAIANALLFAREQDGGEKINIHDMQSMWYELQLGPSYERQGDFGRALKNYACVISHFADIKEDQFDFHQYCLRRMTLRNYVAFIRGEDKIYTHKNYRQALKLAINLYLKLHDKQKAAAEAANGNEAEGGDGEASMTAAEKKKLKNQRKKEAKKAEAEASQGQAAGQQQAGAGAGAGSSKKKPDDDPQGLKLLQKDPLEEATKLAKSADAECSLDPATQVLVYKVYQRHNKPLRQLRALLRLLALKGGDVYATHVIPVVAHFAHTVDLDGLTGAVRGMISSEAPKLLGLSSSVNSTAELRKAGQAYLDRAMSALGKGKAGMEGCMAALSGWVACGKPLSSCPLVASLPTPKPETDTLQECIQVLELLQANACDAAAKTLKSSMAQLFPFADKVRASPLRDEEALKEGEQDEIKALAT